LAELSCDIHPLGILAIGKTGDHLAVGRPAPIDLFVVLASGSFAGSTGAGFSSAFASLAGTTWGFAAATGWGRLSKRAWACSE